MDVTEVTSEEIILRRIPPIADCTLKLTDGSRRATRFSLLLRDDETGLSCTRLAITSPQQLLNLLLLQGKSTAEWMVCRMFVADVRALDLDVMHVPEENDAGHCEIQETAKQAYTKKLASKLAKKTRILTEEEIRSVRAGDQIP